MASVDGRRGGGTARLRPCAATRRAPLHAAAVRADDQLIELVRRDRAPAMTDPLVILLLAWRAEVNRPH